MIESQNAGPTGLDHADECPVTEPDFFEAGDGFHAAFNIRNSASFTGLQAI